MRISEQRSGAVTVLKPEGPLLEADAAAFKQKLMATLSVAAVMPLMEQNLSDLDRPKWLPPVMSWPPPGRRR